MEQVDEPPLSTGAASAVRAGEVRRGVEEAMQRGRAGEARALIRAAAAVDPTLRRDPEWQALDRPDNWSDAWLITAARGEPPDEEALDALVYRYWKPLFARCRLLAPSAEAAADLAQEAWCRVLRTRERLRPDGNVLAYLTVVATNVCRDSARRARRAGPMADRRLGSLERCIGDELDEGLTLGQLVADPRSLGAEDQALLRLAIDQALARLEPRAREVLVARVVEGESCAAIGVRYGRTEQTVSGWVRHALAELRAVLGESGMLADAGVEQ